MNNKHFIKVSNICPTTILKYMNLQIVVKSDNNYLSHIMIINTLTDRDKSLASGIKSRSHCRNFPEIIYPRDFKIQYSRARLDREHEVRTFCHMRSFQKRAVLCYE